MSAIAQDAIDQLLDAKFAKPTISVSQAMSKLTQSVQEGVQSNLHDFDPKTALKAIADQIVKMGDAVATLEGGALAHLRYDAEKNAVVMSEELATIYRDFCMREYSPIRYRVPMSERVNADD